MHLLPFYSFPLIFPRCWLSLHMLQYRDVLVKTVNVPCPLYWQVFSSKQQSVSAESEEGNQNISQQPAKRKSGVKMERDPTILREVIFHPKNFPVNLNQWCSRISPILPNSKFSFSVIEKSFVVRLRMNFIFHPVIYTYTLFSQMNKSGCKRRKSFGFRFFLNYINDQIIIFLNKIYSFIV